MARAYELQVISHCLGLLRKDVSLGQRLRQILERLQFRGLLTAIAATILFVLSLIGKLKLRERVAQVHTVREL